jgi:hypothetical protein
MGTFKYFVCVCVLACMFVCVRARVFKCVNLCFIAIYLLILLTTIVFLNELFLSGAPKPDS